MVGSQQTTAAQAGSQSGVSPAQYRVASRWEGRLVRVVLVLDVIAVLVAATITLALSPQIQADLSRALVLTVALAGAWVVTLAFSRAYEGRFIGEGSEEFKRVVNGAVRLIAIIATISWFGQVTDGRRFVVVALPVALVLDLWLRYSARRILARLRINGHCLHKVLVVGNPRGVAELATRMASSRYAGMRVVGCCVDQPADLAVAEISGVPVVGGLGDVAGAVVAAGATTVAVTESSGLSPIDLRRVSWELEGSGVDFLVAPALTDIAGPRIHIRPVAGFPLLHVEEPELSGGRRLIKAALDRVIAAFALLVLAPLFGAIALAIKVTSDGPVLFSQTRVGMGATPFTMYKFRSMYVDAEQRLAELAAKNESGGVLFKMKQDPRVTKAGKWLRRYSLDELPQLLNVLTGDMSLVGPRPPLQREVDQYEQDVHRRLVVKPGLTGLWQISGRSDLSWDETVRLDLQYVENWSLALDAMIMWKTAFAVVGGRGAY